MKDDINKRSVLRVVAISNVVILLLSVMLASGTPLALACHIDVSATANPSMVRTYDWSIAKTVTPASWDLYPGDQGTSQYTVSVTKSAASDVYTVKGTVTLTNALDRATNGLSIEVYVQRKASGGSWGSPTTKYVVTPSTQLGNGKTGTYDYTITLPQGYVLSGYQYQTYVNVIDTYYSISTTKSFTVPTTPGTVNYDTITVDDTNGQSWQFSASGSKTYPKTFVSPRDAGQNDNTATIRGLGKSASAPVTVNVLEQPTVQFKKADFPVSESAGTVTLTVTMNKAATVPVTVSYQTAPGTASAGTNYVHVANTLTFDPGQTEKTFDVTILDDGIYNNPDIYFYAQITGVTVGPAVVGSPSQATVTLTEASDKPSVQFSKPTYDATENSLQATLGIVLSNPSSHDVTVSYTTHDDSATSPDDYTGTTSGSAVISAGQLTGEIKVPIVNDNIYEGPESFTVTLDSAQGATLGENNPAKVTIKDDEPVPDVQFDSNSYTIAEPGTSVIKTVTVVLSNPCQMPIDVVYSTADGTATVAAGDYITTGGSLTFSPGVTSRTFDVTVKNDGVYSAPDKFFFVNLTSVTTPIGFGLNRNVTMTINELPLTVSMETGTLSISEHNSPTAQVYVILNQPSASPVTVTFSTADGTATAGANYTSNSGTLTFEPGQTKLSIPVGIIDEWGVETPDAFFFVNLTGVSNNARIIAPDVTTVTILDDDQTFTIDLYKGWNLVSSPLIIEPFMVSSIQDKFPQINQVMRYNTDSKKYESYMVGISPKSYDFQWENDRGYLVYCTEPVSITFVGEYWGGRSVNLINGWNMVGWSTLDTSDANTICDYLTGTQQIMGYDASTQTYYSYLEGVSPIRYNFEMSPGAGYLIESDTATSLNYGGIVIDS